MRGKQEAPAPLRADARRNREQIIEAARTLFVRLGPEVPMEEIARTAGVGVGTLYRRFPDRDQLIKAVSLDNFTRLAEMARAVERDEPDPERALTALLYSTLELRLGMTMTTASGRISEALQHTPEISRLRDEVVEIAERFLHRAQDIGAIRADVQIGDVILALVMVGRLAPITNHDLSDMVFQRLVALMMDGIRATSSAPLPGRPISATDIEDLRRHGGFAGFGKLGPIGPPTPAES